MLFSKRLRSRHLDNHNSPNSASDLLVLPRVSRTRGRSARSHKDAMYHGRRSLRDGMLEPAGKFAGTGVTFWIPVAALLIKGRGSCYRTLFRRALMFKLLKIKWSGRVDSNHRPPGPESGVPRYLLEYRANIFVQGGYPLDSGTSHMLGSGFRCFS